MLSFIKITDNKYNFIIKKLEKLKNWVLTNFKNDL